MDSYKVNNCIFSTLSCHADEFSVIGSLAYSAQLMKLPYIAYYVADSGKLHKHHFFLWRKNGVHLTACGGQYWKLNFLQLKNHPSGTKPGFLVSFWLCQPEDWPRWSVQWNWNVHHSAVHERNATFIPGVRDNSYPELQNSSPQSFIPHVHIFMVSILQITFLSPYIWPVDNTCLKLT